MNEVKISRQEIISLCRLCLAKDLASIDIFEDGNELRHLYTKIVACLPVQVFANDTLPHKICEVCNAKVDDFYQFWTSTAKNQKQLNDWLQVATDQKVDHASVAVPRIKVEAEERDDYEDYDDGVRADDSDDDEEEASAPKRIKTTHSDTEEDTKPTDLVSSLPDSSDVNGKKKSKEHKLLSVDGDKKSSFLPVKKAQFKCVTCGKCFKYQKACQGHTERVHLNPNRSYECGICKDGFPTHNKLQKHLCSVHYNDLVLESFNDESKIGTTPEKTRKNEPVDTGDYSLEEWKEMVASKSTVCPVCKKLFNNPRNMRRHLREVHSSHKKYVCDICGKQFACIDSVTRHKRDHLGIARIITRKYECDICHLKFRTKLHVSEHINTHTGYKPYDCSMCKKSFAFMKSLRLHVKKHKQQAGLLSSEDSYHCMFCNKIFLEHHQFKRHMGWVHGDECHNCEICGAKVKSSMQAHMRKHTGEKPFECAVCMKCFAAHSAYKLHLLKHESTNVIVPKNNKCPICDLRFKDIDELNAHYPVHYDHYLSSVGQQQSEEQPVEAADQLMRAPDELVQADDQLLRTLGEIVQADDELVKAHDQLVQ